MQGINYMHILSTSLILVGIIIFLWILLIVNGVLRNPLKISIRFLNKSCIEIKRLDATLLNHYTKKGDNSLKALKKHLKIVIRYLRQFTYENDDDRVKNVIKKLQTIDISLSLIKKVCYQRGIIEAKEIINPIIKELSDINDLICLIRNEEKNYEKSYKDIVKK